MRRRTFLAAAAVAAVPTGLAADAMMNHRAGEQPRGDTRSDDVAAALGVNIHLNFADTPYRQTDRVVDAVQDLGIRHVRDRVVASPAVVGGLSALAAGGVRVQGICGALGDPETMTTLLSSVVDQYRDPTAVFSAFEGINEPNNDGVPWVEETRSKTFELARARSDTGLEEIPVVAPALARVNSGGVEGGDLAQQADNLGSLVPAVDFGNIHVYARSQLPSAEIDEFAALARTVSGDRPLMCTEAGYFTAMNYRGGAYPTPPDVVATYIPRLLMEHWSRGMRRLFLYELLDDPDPANVRREANFGMLRVPSMDPSAPWSPKPHYFAVKNLVAQLSDPGPPHDPVALDVAVRSTVPVRHLALSRRDGSWLLALWRDVSCYDAAARVHLTVDPARVRLRFDRRRRVRLLDPVVSASPLRTFDRSAEASFTLADRLILAWVD